VVLTAIEILSTPTLRVFVGTVAGATLIWWFVQWMNRRDDPRRVEPPADRR
jgi:hypothetical protein